MAYLKLIVRPTIPDLVNLQVLSRTNITNILQPNTIMLNGMLKHF